MKTACDDPVMPGKRCAVGGCSTEPVDTYRVTINGDEADYLIDAHFCQPHLDSMRAQAVEGIELVFNDDTAEPVRKETAA